MTISQKPQEIYKLLGLMTIKLNYTNYISWSYQLQILLQSQNLFGYIDGSTACPTIDIEGVTCESDVVYETWKTTDKVLLSFLLATLDSDIMDYVVGSKSCREAWVCVREMFSSSSRINVMQLKTDIRAISKGSDSIERYLLRIKQAKNKLRAVGITISDEDTVVLTLSGLPDEYEVLKMIILCRETLISENDMRLHLLAAEQKIKSSVHYSSSMSGRMDVQCHSKKSQGNNSWSSRGIYSNDKRNACVGNLKGSNRSRGAGSYNDWGAIRSSSSTKSCTVGMCRGNQECETWKEGNERYTSTVSCSVNEDKNWEFHVLGLTGVEPAELVNSARNVKSSEDRSNKLMSIEKNVDLDFTGQIGIQIARSSISGGNESDDFGDKNSNIVNLRSGVKAEGNGNKGSALECYGENGDNSALLGVGQTVGLFSGEASSDCAKIQNLGNTSRSVGKNENIEFSVGDFCQNTGLMISGETSCENGETVIFGNHGHSISQIAGIGISESNIDKTAGMRHSSAELDKDEEIGIFGGGNVNSGANDVDIPTGGDVGSKKENRDATFVEENIGVVCNVRVLLMITISMILTLPIMVSHYRVLSMTCLIVMHLMKQLSLVCRRYANMVYDIIWLRQVCLSGSEHDDVSVNEKNILGATSGETSKFACLFADKLGVFFWNKDELHSLVAGTNYELQIFKGRWSWIMTYVPLMRKFLIIHNELQTYMKVCIALLQVKIRWLFWSFQVLMV